MTAWSKYTIIESASILEALQQIDTLSNEGILTLFVVNPDQQLVGSVTDGDIRRALLHGCNLDSPIAKAMMVEFKWLDEACIDTKKIATLRELKIYIVPIRNSRGELVRIINLNKIDTCLPVDAVLMAGGKGERLRPLTLSTPKPLLKVGDRAIIDYNIHNLLRHGIEQISITVNYLKEQLIAHFAQPLEGGVQVSCVSEPQFLGTMGSIKYIPHFHNDVVLVMNSDLFTNIDLEGFYNHFIESGAEMSAAAVPYTVSIPFGIFEIEDRHDIVGIKEKPSFNYYANAGIYLMKRSVIEQIPEGEFFNATDLIEQIIARGERVVRYPLTGYWFDIGSPADFNKVQDIAKHITL